MTSKTTKVRFVYCPQCRKLLIELSNIPVYKCGGCGTILKGIIPWISHILRSISTNDCWFKRHRWTGRYEAHLWDNSCRREGQTHKGLSFSLISGNFYLIFSFSNKSRFRLY
ncbi:uncharacterized protein LOC131233792 [Magnolia sinica]|uniref:uncharacterized protein LOC131233792 n=1 Tax=Magnolia sinica TaxID=86752 RepID=UPI002658FA36|nr:uncharacterized protein LOC131233792 [Magnolia sinica]